MLEIVEIKLINRHYVDQLVDYLSIKKTQEHMA